MNTIVFVLVVFGYGGYLIPTIEFSTKQKCEIFAQELMDKENSKSLFSDSRKKICMKVEK